MTTMSLAVFGIIIVAIVALGAKVRVMNAPFGNWHVQPGEDDDDSSGKKTRKRRHSV